MIRDKNRQKYVFRVFITVQTVSCIRNIPDMTSSPKFYCQSLRLSPSRIWWNLSPDSAERSLISKVICILSPVNHKGLHQGWKRTSIHLLLKLTLRTCHLRLTIIIFLQRSKNMLHKKKNYKKLYPSRARAQFRLSYNWPLYIGWLILGI